MTYAEKLKDPRWQRKRLEVLKRDRFSCTFCGDKKNTLHVHHSKYNGEPWQADNILLKTLCDACHKLIEEYKSEFVFTAILKDKIPVPVNGKNAYYLVGITTKNYIVLAVYFTADDILETVVKMSPTSLEIITKFYKKRKNKISHESICSQ